MPSAIQCLQACLGSSGFSRAHRTLRALQASQPEKHVRSLARGSQPLTGRDFWETNRTLGLTPVCVGKGERKVSKEDSKREKREDIGESERS